MKHSIILSGVVASLLVAGTCFGEAAATVPAGSSGVCNDGSYSTAAVKKGACRGHKGVKEWYSEAPAAAAKPAAPAMAPAPTMAPSAAAPVVATVAKPAPVAAPAMPAAPAAAAAPAKPAGFTPPAMAAPGGGAGKVWANKSSKVYHCSDDKWYGKTKDGAYMTEAEATAAGYHADHGKACKS